MPPITRRLRGLFCLLPLPVVGRIRFGVCPCGLIICLLCLADLFLFFTPCQIFRLLAVIRTGSITIRATLAGRRPLITNGFGHYRPPFLRLPPGHGLTRRAVFPGCQLEIEVFERYPYGKKRAYASRWSSIPGSNRRYLLGRQVCYRYTNAAYCRRLTARRLPSFRLSR